MQEITSVERLIITTFDTRVLQRKGSGPPGPPSSIIVEFALETGEGRKGPRVDNLRGMVEDQDPVGVVQFMLEGPGLFPRERSLKGPS